MKPTALRAGNNLMEPAPQPRQPSLAAQRDRDIVELLQRGNHAGAFELVAERYGSKVYRLCVALLRNPAAAQDAAQESLIRVWKALPGYDGRAALSTWIYAITRNRCLSALERAREALSLSDEAVQAEAEAIAATNSDNDAGTASTIRRLVDDLPESARRVITLFYFEERSVAEVAAMLGCPEGTVKTHLFRARAALLEKLTTLGLADPSQWAT
jgi:RNA polymerase sigma-70 factor (ECF subfamily)